MLFDTHSSGRSGSPSVTGSTSRCSAPTSPASLSLTALRPPPARRTCPRGNGAASRSSSPRLIVERARPVIRETNAHYGRCAYLGGRKQATPALVQLAPNHFPAIPDGVRVDHPIDLRPFDPLRNPPKLSHSDARDSFIVRSVLSTGETARIDPTTGSMGVRVEILIRGVDKGPPRRPDQPPAVTAMWRRHRRDAKAIIAESCVSPFRTHSCPAGLRGRMAA